MEKINDKTYVETAKNMLRSILANEPTEEGLAILYEISHNNTDLMIQHFKAVGDIFKKAEKILKEEKKNES